MNTAEDTCAPETELDSVDTTVEHGELIKKKYFLNKIYHEIYQFFLDNMQEGEQSLELGSGAGFIQEYIPSVITSDVVELPTVDKVIFAENLPFEEESLANIFMFNVLHHIQDNEQFLREASRALIPGGRIVMIEPGSTLFSRFIYTYLHHEPCEPKQKEWQLPKGGRLSMANAMLPWIVFKRDREKFEKLFPEFDITHYQNFMPFKYLVSGGLSGPQLLPSALYPLYSGFENMLAPLNDYFGMFVQIVVEKKISGR